MNILRYILTQPELEEKPPVLLDIGASGELHQKWKAIARYSICVAFDADDREFSFAEKKSSHYRKLYVINRIVTDKPDKAVDFYLTKFPFCSSSLPPDNESLNHWAFGDKFIVEKKLLMPAVTLSDTLSHQNIGYIDWFKADTQGTDLRLFMSLPAHVRKEVLAAEFEPGIMDGYQGEDKLFSVLSSIREEGFFLSEMDVKGSQRIPASYLKNFSSLEKLGMQRALKKSPGWAEVTCLRELAKLNADKRAYLLLYAFAMLEDQYGYALEIAEAAKHKWNEDRFFKLASHAQSKLKGLSVRLPLVVLKKQFNKLLRRVHV